MRRNLRDEQIRWICEAGTGKCKERDCRAHDGCSKNESSLHLLFPPPGDARFLRAGESPSLFQGSQENAIAEHGRLPTDGTQLVLFDRKPPLVTDLGADVSPQRAGLMDFKREAYPGMEAAREPNGLLQRLTSIFGYAVNR